jgi:hypothetical protein
MKKACNVVWNGSRWMDSEGILDSYEQDGKYIWTDGHGVFETSELINLDEVFWSEEGGFVYKGSPLDTYIISEV